MSQPVLVCLLTGQHIPNLISVKHYKPRTLILVASTAMASRAKPFLAALKAGGHDYELCHEIVQLADETNLEKVIESATGILENHKNQPIILNITGGNKVMTIGFYTAFKDKSKIVYIENNNREGFLDLAGGCERFNGTVGIEEFLQGYGTMGEKSLSTLQQSESRAQAGYDCALALASGAQSVDLLQFDPEDETKDRELHQEFRRNGGKLVKSYWTNFAINHQDALAQWGVDPALESVAINKYQAEYLTGGWLEVFIWGLLKKQAHDLNINDVNIGFVAKPLGNKNASGNDFDVCFIRNLELFIIECKSGDQSHDSQADVLYKVEAIKRQYGALNARTIVATTGTNIYKRNTEIIKQNLLDRLSYFNATIIDRKGIQELALAHENPETIANILFPRPMAR